MAVNRTYHCDLCRDAITLNGSSGKLAHGIHWQDWPHKGWITRAAGQTERHLCSTCISSIQAMPAICGDGFPCNGGPNCQSDHK